MGQITTLQQFAPLIAAVIALVGVAATIVVNGRRESARYSAAREDDYRREQRQAIAAVAVSAHRFGRELNCFDESGRWMRASYERALALQDSVENAILDLLNQLTVARLLVHSEKLQTAIDALYMQWSVTSEHADDALSAFWAHDETGATASVLTIRDSLTTVSTAASRLHSVALKELRPTIVSEETGRQLPKSRRP